MTLTNDLNDFLNPILATFNDNLRYRLNGWLATVYLRGSAQMIQWGRTKLTDMPIFYEGPPMQEAIEYAQKHVAELIKGLNDETRDRIRQIIADAIENKRGIDGLARDLRKEFDDMTRVRSQVIARTETADSLEQAFMDRAKAMGVTGKEWIVTDPCEICAENGDAGIIPIDEAFPSGDMRPPAHPQCRCSLAPVMME
jgi:SPP1 gp7 family putative phage head morphogenesis protein